MNRIERFDVAQPTIIVKHINGEVTVEPSSDGSTTIELSGTSRNAEELISQSQIEARGDQILVVVSKPRRRFGRVVISRDEAVAVRLKVPASTSLNITTVSGDVRSSAECDDTRVTSVSGDVEIYGTINDGLVTTVSGELIIDASFADLTTKSVSGDMRITAHGGRSLTASSVSGDIDVFIRPGLGIDIDAKTLSGELESSIPLDGQTGNERVPLKIVGKTISGDINVRRASV
jgi:hypothetical protein